MYRLFRPLLFRLDAERAHRLTLAAARLVQPLAPWLVAPFFKEEHPALAVQCWGLTFPNPVGLAAGLDKNARLVRFWEALGFGFAEVGSVSARPSRGNPRPRLFRLPEDRALINRMGLNNDGAERVARRLRRLRHRRRWGSIWPKRTTRTFSAKRRGRLLREFPAAGPAGRLRDAEHLVPQHG
ncbi:hypothetical protein [Rhodothermus marinus]|uniref:hypothetical protein n=1 Tax=Rhodothermus marinus TaxID=29549 RepID=UPI000AE66B38|nr:hypothetical protein [Rhodothermus marinus]